MQTFLPYPDFKETARVLDYRRLGKQRVETKQILKALNGETKGWVSHPATKMWGGHEYALAEYGLAVCTEWKARGYKDTLTEFFLERIAAEADGGGGQDLPVWFGMGELHRSHQSNLVRKNPEFYMPIFPGVPEDLPYVWPSV
jgi:hypothetical protein